MHILKRSVEKRNNNNEVLAAASAAENGNSTEQTSLLQRQSPCLGPICSCHLCNHNYHGCSVILPQWMLWIGDTNLYNSHLLSRVHAHDSALDLCFRPTNPFTVRFISRWSGHWSLLRYLCTLWAQGHFSFQPNKMTGCITHISTNTLLISFIY
jgi:hypothetical protein